MEKTLEQEQEFQVNKLIRKIERLEADTLTKQSVLEQVCVKLLLNFMKIYKLLCFENGEEAWRDYFYISIS